MQKVGRITKAEIIITMKVMSTMLQNEGLTRRGVGGGQNADICVRAKWEVRCSWEPTEPAETGTLRDAPAHTRAAEERKTRGGGTRRRTFCS